MIQFETKNSVELLRTILVSSRGLKKNFKKLVTIIVAFHFMERRLKTANVFRSMAILWSSEFNDESVSYTVLTNQVNSDAVLKYLSKNSICIFSNLKILCTCGTNLKVLFRGNNHSVQRQNN